MYDILCRNLIRNPQKFWFLVTTLLPEDLEVLVHFLSIGKIFFAHLFQKTVHEIPKLNYCFESFMLHLLDIDALQKGHLQHADDNVRHAELAQDFLQQPVVFSSSQFGSISILIEQAKSGGNESVSRITCAVTRHWVGIVAPGAIDHQLPQGSFNLIIQSICDL